MAEESRPDAGQRSTHPERSSRGVDGKTTYSEGIFMGYRWFDQQNLAPLYPFGHGLSYTTFTYSRLKAVRSTDGGLEVSFTIKNTGKAASDEVAQIYLGAPEVCRKAHNSRSERSPDSTA